MKKLKLGKINCRTQEEREMVLDIFEMLGYRWMEGQHPRSFRSYNAPMSYNVRDVDIGKFTHDSQLTYNAIEAKDLRNMWISLKRRQNNEIR